MTCLLLLYLFDICTSDASKATNAQSLKSMPIFRSNWKGLKSLSEIPYTMVSLVTKRFKLAQVCKYFISDSPTIRMIEKGGNSKI